MPISREDEERIAKAIREAEIATSGEIVCVIARTSSNYEYVPIVWAAMIALTLPWFLILLTQWSVQRVFVAQLLTFLILVAILSVPSIRMALVPNHIKRVRAHREAMEQFFIRGLTRTKDRAGVLVFVSLAERYARIVADEGIASHVPAQRWQEAVDRLIALTRQERLADGCVAAVQICGRLLAEFFPARDDDVNELPDRVYVI